MNVIDFLTCGGCQTEFPLSSITIFMEHKKSECTMSPSSVKPENTFNNYACYTCPEQFGAAVSLLLHAQLFHKQKIFLDRTNTSVSHLQYSRETNVQQDNIIDGKELTIKEMEQYSSVEIPEPLSKCCTSVIPKKRKHHFETKHRTSFFKSARLRRQQHSMSSNDIYINVEPSQDDMPGCETQQQNSTEHSTFLPVGKTMTIPISRNTMSADYVGIHYSDSPPNNGNSQYSSASNSTKEETPSTPATPNTTASTSGETRDSPPSAVMKKKYPTSKPFKCDHCEDSFNQRIHLKKHQSKHTGVKPYKCNHCDYATVERSHLKVHIRIHTGEKPFKCTHCEYSTAQNSTLKIHLKRHHGGALSLECTHCGKHFPEKTQLLWHKQEHGQVDSTLTDRQLPASSASAIGQSDTDEQKPSHLPKL